MKMQSLLNQFLGDGSAARGIAGGAAAGGVMALLVGNKSARKFAGKAAAVGGAALLGGLAYKGYQNWKRNQAVESAPPATDDDIQAAGPAFMPNTQVGEAPLELTLVRAMIAAAKADGTIDAKEQSAIFDAVERMSLSSEQKGVVFDALQKEIRPEDLAATVRSLEHKSEVYLASCLAITLDDPRERAYLDRLARALELPAELAAHLEHQAEHGVA